MERLTNKNGKFIANGKAYELKLIYSEEETSEESKLIRDTINNAAKKLSKLEDIEEELGIDLFTLFKASKEDCYFKNLEGVFRAKIDCFDLENHYVHVKHRGWYSFKSHGVSWALTKEELE